MQGRSLMDTETAHILTVLGQMRESQLHHGSMLLAIIENQKHLARQQADILKAASRPKVTLRSLWEDYLKPISQITAWAPTAWILAQIFRGVKLQDVLAKLSAFF